MTHYQRPGLRPLVQGINAPVRGLYQASNGNGYCVIGANVYAVAGPLPWILTLLGTISPGINTPVSMTDNGTTLLLVDGIGTGKGWTVSLANNSFAQVVDGTGTFVGANKVDFIDTFLLFAPAAVSPNLQFGSTHSGDPPVFDPLYLAGKTNYPDPLLSMIVNRHEILLFGRLKSEIWYNAGNPLFPFAELPGAYIEHGLAAIYSLASADISVFWLSQDLQGQGMVMRQRGYQTTRVSNHALEFAIRKMKNTTGISDAIGYTYQQDGHVFYVLHFPAGDQTWVFDDAVNDPVAAWHQEAWTDSNGQLHRHRGNCYASLYGMEVVGDWQNGTLYAMDLNTYTDTVGGVVGPITFVRSFPHIGLGESPGGQMTRADGRRFDFTGFWADLECGNGPVNVDGSPAQITLRWSDDRGKTFGTDVLQSSGAPGEYLAQPQWRGLGIARDRVFEIQHQIAGAAALNGAWVAGKVLNT